MKHTSGYSKNRKLPYPAILKLNISYITYNYSEEEQKWYHPNLDTSKNNEQLMGIYFG
jgi:hypothetical protein